MVEVKIDKELYKRINKLLKKTRIDLTFLRLSLL